MPPANTPSDAPPFTSAVVFPNSTHNTAAALTHPVDINDANDENVSFMRARHHSPPESSSSSRTRRRRLALLPEVDLESMDIEEHRRSRQPGEIHRRFPVLRRQREDVNVVPNYEGRLSSARSLYGWAPGSEEETNEHNERYGLPPNTHADSVWYGRGPSDQETIGEATLPRISRRDVIGRTLPPYSGDISERSDSNSQHRAAPSTITEALLQSMRRGSRFASRTRTLQNYILERERTGEQEAEERERERERDRNGPSSLPRALRINLRNISGDVRDRAIIHRHYLRDTPPSSRLRDTIKYLEGIRFSNSLEESVSSAIQGGFVHEEYWTETQDDVDLILDTSTLTPPANCSWLQAGAVFVGSQKAAYNNMANQNLQMLGHRISSNQAQSTTPVLTSGGDAGRISVSTTSGRRYWANNLHQTPVARETKDEHWPVKVTIHSVDYSSMSLTGSMEAYNIPDKTSPTLDAHIVTFLEGEIIDLNIHTLETTSFKADADIDSTYWRELQPFKDLSDEQMIKNLLSKKWMTEELRNNWILMRWKERCFITPTDSRQGLTISGFYYISLRRDTGEIEGLYYDPGSSPYQQLSLKPERRNMTFSSYDLR